MKIEKLKNDKRTKKKKIQRYPHSNPSPVIWKIFTNFHSVHAHLTEKLPSFDF